MSLHLTNYLVYAETVADRLIKVKDKTLGAVVDYLIPIPQTRYQIRQWLVNLIAMISRPLSTKTDQWIEEDKITVANLFSLSRAAAGPIFFMFVQLEAGIIYYLLLLAWAGISDYVDGVLAKKMNQQTELGATLDAGSDKVFAGFAALAFWQYIWLWPVNAILFVVLDSFLMLMGLTLYRAKQHGQYQGQAEVKANWLGKTKFNLQAGACLCYIFGWLTAGNYFLASANFFAAGSILRHLAPKK